MLRPAAQCRPSLSRDGLWISARHSSFPSRAHAWPSKQPSQMGVKGQVRLRAAAQSAGSGGSSTSSTSSIAATTIPPLGSMDYEPSVKQVQRKQRLTTLLELRRVYRDLLHAASCLDYPSPVYQPPQPQQQEQQQAQQQQQQQQASASVDDREDATPKEDSEDDILEQARQNEALYVVSEMQLTSDQLKASLRTLPPGFGWVFGPGREADGEQYEQYVRVMAQDYAVRLRARVESELPLLPFGGAQQAQALVDARNARFSRRPALSGGGGPGPGNASMDAEPGSGPSAIERLEQAEKVAEQFVAQRIKPALRRAQEAELGDLLRGTGSYLKGLWARLNGGGGGGQGSGLEALGLPLPVASRRESELAINQLGLELESLEKRLQEASKARENKLRKAGLPGRVQMAIQLKGLDADVLEISQLLAVRTLQLEMEYIFRSLEDEALDVEGYDSRAGGVTAVLADREGSSTELALLVADFVQLEEQLIALSQALSSNCSSSGGGAADKAASGTRLLGMVGEDVLQRLAEEIPDMRIRVGVMDQMVFGGQGFSITRLQLQGQDSLDKVREGIDFLVRGVRLLNSDVGSSGKLFWRAALGGRLKPREVAALRRTGRDVLTFIPFSIILIVPITPLGHVLVFSLIQTYFPSFFPSCFTKKRQEIMVKYEELQRQLQEAQAQADQAEEEAELARAAAAVARLTSPEDSSSSGEESVPAGRRAPALGRARAQDRISPTALRASRALGAAVQRAKEQGVDEPVQPHEAKVRVLEEKLSKVLETVNLGETFDDEEDGGARGR